MSVERTVLCLPPAVSSAHRFLSESGCMEAARNAGGGVVRRTIAGGSGEGKILHHTLVVCGANNNGFGQRALTLAILALQQVTFSLFTAQDLPRARHLESFGDGLTGLCFTCGPWHGAGRLGTDRPLAREKWLIFRRNERFSLVSGQGPGARGQGSGVRGQ